MTTSPRIPDGPTPFDDEIESWRGKRSKAVAAHDAIVQHMQRMRARTRAGQAISSHRAEGLQADLETALGAIEEAQVVLTRLEQTRRDWLALRWAAATQ